MNTREAFKKEVIDSNANRIGRLDDLIFDLPSGTISHLVVKTGLLKELKIAIGSVSKSGDNIILSVTKESLGGHG